MKRSYKIQEFVAHSGNVNSVHIGRKTGCFVATGGDDKKVNIWHLTKPNAVLSLSGNSTAIDCVAFDRDEELIVAGTSGGTLKLWDLEAEKVVRTFAAGHRANIGCVDFHPFGDYFASGSLDTNVKLWDIRRKNCLQTYKGHSNAIRVIRFSPDGRWLASGSEDSTVKLWDLTAGKLMYEFTLHSGPISCLEFHPDECLLVTGSADRTIKFWDLDKFQFVSSSALDATKPRAMMFSPNGKSIISAFHDSIKVWGWEPCVCYDTVDVRWNTVLDMAAPTNTTSLYGVAASGGQISVWHVALDQVQGVIGAPVLPANAVYGSNAAVSTPVLHSAGAGSSAPGSTVLEPPNMRSASTADDAMRVAPRLQQQQQQPQPTSQIQLQQQFQQLQLQQQLLQSPQSHFAAQQQPLQPLQPQLQPHFQPPAVAAVQPQVHQPMQPQRKQPMGGDIPVTVALTGDGPIGLEPQSFFPAKMVQQEVSEMDAIAELTSHHRDMTALYNMRLTNLKLVRSLWAQGNIKGAIEALAKVEDIGAAADVFDQLLIPERVKHLNLDIAVASLPIAAELINAKYEEYISIGLKSALLLLKTFSPVIKNTLTASGFHTNVGVDIMLEERVDKCKACLGAFVIMRSRAEALSRRPDALGDAAREFVVGMTSSLPKV